MSYTPPASTAVDFTWVGTTAYTPPASTAVNFTWGASIPEVTGTGAGVVPVGGAAGAVAGAVGAGVATVPVAGEGAGYFGDMVVGVGGGVVPVIGAAAAVSGSFGAAAASVPVTGGAAGLAGAAGAASAIIRIGAEGVALHPRYELAGSVKIGGVLVDRQVRAYLRSTGALVGDVATVAGVFRIHAGFEEDEYYVTPVDLSPSAVDWSPPTANRVLSVLAVDA